MRNEDGYELWLRYRKVDDSIRIAQYREAIQHVAIMGESETVEVIRSEIARAIPSLLGKPIPISSQEISPNTSKTRVYGAIPVSDILVDLPIPHDDSHRKVNHETNSPTNPNWPALGCGFSLAG